MVRGASYRLLISVSLLILMLILLTSCSSTPEHSTDPIPDPGKGNGEHLQTSQQDPAAATAKEDAKSAEEKKNIVPGWGDSQRQRFKGESQQTGTAADSKEGFAFAKPNVYSPADQVLALQKELAAKNPNDDVEQFKLAMLHFLNGDYPTAQDAIDRVRNHPFLNYAKAAVARELGEYQAHRELMKQLNEELARIDGFRIESIRLCTAVRGFRQYEEDKTGRIYPGGYALIYVEPRNFQLRDENQKKVLHLSYEWKLYNDRLDLIQVPAWGNAQKSDREDVIKYNDEVSDFYQTFKLPLPANLAVGSYRIKVSIRDETLRKSFSSFVPFNVPAVMTAPGGQK